MLVLLLAFLSFCSISSFIVLFLFCCFFFFICSVHPYELKMDSAFAAIYYLSIKYISHVIILSTILVRRSKKYGGDSVMRIRNYSYKLDGSKTARIRCVPRYIICYEFYNNPFSAPTDYSFKYLSILRFVSLLSCSRLLPFFFFSFFLLFVLVLFFSCSP